jgi:hexokinase
MLINIEWGAFDNERMVLPITKYDLSVDQGTENPGKQQFEKMISGMYLGEIVRYCIVDLAEKGELFGGVLSPALLQPHKFETQYMSRIERDHSYNLSDTKSVLEDLLNVQQSTLEDRRAIKRICELVGIRAARLSAAAIAAVVGKTNKLDGCTVAIDGSVFEHYPHFKSRMLDALREIFGLSADNLTLALAHDGSGVGAALVAAVMSNEQHGQQQAK